ncbi:MAG: hypothetical protein KDA37_01705 [Planctomycetales bacterium]|nr:hypothetical protein [Planctomycetales bacterium]
MLRSAQIAEEIVAKLAAVLGLPKEDILNAETLDLHSIDSIELVEVVMGIEEEFDVNLADWEAEDVRSISDVVQMILRCILPQDP